MSVLMVLMVTCGGWALLSVGVAMSLARSIAIGDAADRNLAPDGAAAEYRLVG